MVAKISNSVQNANGLPVVRKAAHRAYTAERDVTQC